MLSERWVKKYMRVARNFGEDDNRCYSRHIGVVIVDPVNNKILATGLNGPPPDVPPCDSREYLEEIVWPQLSYEERRFSLSRFGERMENPLSRETILEPDEAKGLFLKNAENCGQCPRKLVGAKSGERLELCSCAHGETNAINNANGNISGAWMFCACGVPCWDCSKAIIRAKISRVYAVDDPSYANHGKDYSFGSRWLLKQANVELIVKPADYYN